MAWQKRCCIHRPDSRKPRRTSGPGMGARREQPLTRNATSPEARSLTTS